MSRPDLWGPGSGAVPSNQANGEYQTIAQGHPEARDIDQASSALEGMGLVGGTDFEKLSSARLLSSSEYTVNTSLGYVSLRAGLQADQVLAVAYEYTYGGVTYRVSSPATAPTSARPSLSRP